MPEFLQFEDSPNVLREYHIEPFRQEYIPGYMVLCIEGHNGDKVFFQIPKPVALKLSESNLEALKKQVHTWWLTRVGRRVKIHLLFAEIHELDHVDSMCFS